MNAHAVLGLSVLMSFVAFGIVTSLYIWPRVRRMGRDEALVGLLAPHAFRFVGLSFLVPGVVAPTLPHGFAAPAAYGDLIAALLSMAAIFSLRRHASFAIPLVWLFNLWGAADLLNAIYQGQIGYSIGPGALGASFYIPTAVVPPLLVIHGLIFRLLLSRKASA
jgi:hypothetical protein